MGDYKTPVMRLAVPFVRYVSHHKEQQLQKNIICREYRSGFRDLPKLPAETLYGIGCINQTHLLIGVLEEVCQFIPVVSLQIFTATGISSTISNRMQQTTPMPHPVYSPYIDLLEIGGKALHILRYYEARR